MQWLEERRSHIVHQPGWFLILERALWLCLSSRFAEWLRHMHVRSVDHQGSKSSTKGRLRSEQLLEIELGAGAKMEKGKVEITGPEVSKLPPPSQTNWTQLLLC